VRLSDVQLDRHHDAASCCRCAVATRRRLAGALSQRRVVLYVHRRDAASSCGCTVVMILDTCLEHKHKVNYLMVTGGDMNLC
jgi:hypothetical protein